MILHSKKAERFLTVPLSEFSGDLIRPAGAGFKAVTPQGLMLPASTAALAKLNRRTRSENRRQWEALTFTPTSGRSENAAPAAFRGPWFVMIAKGTGIARNTVKKHYGMMVGLLGRATMIDKE